MQKEIIFQKKVNALSFLLFLVGMIILFFFEWLPIWAAVSASAFISVTLRQFLAGRLIDIIASLLIFGLLFFTNSYLCSEFWTGILLIIGSLYAFIRQCFDVYDIKRRQRVESEDKEDKDAD